MALNPYVLGVLYNSKGQEILFLEHPTRGDEECVICACLTLELADYSGFYELDDMLDEHGEYEPWFDEQGRFQIGDLGNPNE